MDRVRRPDASARVKYQQRPSRRRTRYETQTREVDDDDANFSASVPERRVLAKPSETDGQSDTRRKRRVRARTTKKFHRPSPPGDVGTRARTLYKPYRYDYDADLEHDLECGHTSPIPSTNSIVQRPRAVNDERARRPSRRGGEKEGGRDES